MITGPHFSQSEAHLIHFCCEWAAVLTGVWLYKICQRRRPAQQQTPLFLIICCIAGAGIGNKLLFLFEIPQMWQQYGRVSLLMGQTIVGGMLGGLLGIELGKKCIGYHTSTGDAFILPLTLGIVIGRTGCFLAGLHDGTYGIKTALPWGVNFGDGIARHPTQIYDQLAVISMAGLLFYYRRQLGHVPGLAFKLFLAGYLLWRLFIDGFKPIPYSYWGLSGIQLACLIALLLYLPFIYRDLRRL